MGRAWFFFHFSWIECWFRITFSSYFNCKQIKIYYYLVQNRNLDMVSFKRTPDVHSYVVNKNVYDTFSPKLHIVQFLKWLLFGTLWIFYVLFLFYYATFGGFISNSTYLHSAAIFWHSFSLVRWINYLGTPCTLYYREISSMYTLILHI